MKKLYLLTALAILTSASIIGCTGGQKPASYSPAGTEAGYTYTITPTSPQRSFGEDKYDNFEPLGGEWIAAEGDDVMQFIFATPDCDISYSSTREGIEYSGIEDIQVQELTEGEYKYEITIASDFGERIYYMSEDMNVLSADGFIYNRKMPEPIVVNSASEYAGLQEIFEVEESVAKRFSEDFYSATDRRLEDAEIEYTKTVYGGSFIASFGRKQYYCSIGYSMLDEIREDSADGEILHQIIY